MNKADGYFHVSKYLYKYVYTESNGNWSAFEKSTDHVSVDAELLSEVVVMFHRWPDEGPSISHARHVSDQELEPLSFRLAIFLPQAALCCIQILEHKWR